MYMHMYINIPLIVYKPCSYIYLFIYIYGTPPPKDPRFSVCFELFVCNPCLFVLHVVCMSVFPREYPNI